MATAPIDITILSPEEKPVLIERLWDSLHGEVAVSAAQRAELTSRMQAIERGELPTVALEVAISAIRAGRRP